MHESEEWLQVESLDLEGQGVAHRANGKVVFIEGALPGETVRVNVSRRKNQWEQGQVSAIRRESSQRQPGPCTLRGRHMWSDSADNWADPLLDSESAAASGRAADLACRWMCSALRKRACSRPDG